MPLDKEVLADPEIRASFSTVGEFLYVASQQQQNATPRDVSKTLWFPDWDWFMMGEAQDYILVEQLVARSAGRQVAGQGESREAQYPGLSPGAIGQHRIGANEQSGRCL